MVPRKIGLAGKSGSGKDWVADHISTRYGYRKYAVADPIREETALWLRSQLTSNWTEKGLELVVEAICKMVWEKPTPSGIRVLLQWWGTEFRCSESPSYWVDQLIARLRDPHESVVVSDIRTPAEMAAIRNVGGEVWFVERPGVASVGIPNHHTEVALAGAEFDRRLCNHGSIADLECLVDWIFKEC